MIIYAPRDIGYHWPPFFHGPGICSASFYIVAAKSRSPARRGPLGFLPLALSPCPLCSAFFFYVQYDFYAHSLKPKAHPPPYIRMHSVLLYRIHSLLLQHPCSTPLRRKKGARWAEPADNPVRGGRRRSHCPLAPVFPSPLTESRPPHKANPHNGGFATVADAHLRRPPCRLLETR